MTAHIPIEEMKNAEAFTAKVKSEREVIVTKDGRAVFCCLDMDSVHALAKQASEADLLSCILAAENENRTGAGSAYVDFSPELPNANLTEHD